MYSPRPTARIKVNLRGFILLELAIALAILGVLAGLSLPLLTAALTREKIVKTQEHQKQIVHALAAYVLVNHRLPCPADPAANGPDVGLMRMRCDRKASDAEGIVPFRSLGIEESMAKDGFNHWITYAVTPGLTDHFKTLVNDKGLYAVQQSFCHADVSDVPLKLLGAGRQPVIDPEIKDNPIAIILVSHGSKGEGAYLGGNANRRQILTKNADKDENSNGDLVFVVPTNNNTFDDRIVWVSRAHLMGYYGRMPCR